MSSTAIAAPCADLDLTQAVLTEGEVTLRVFSLLGGSNIIVPDGVQVEHSGFGLLGWEEVEPLNRDAPPRGAPVVRIRSISVLGGTDVKRGAPRAVALALAAARPATSP